MNKITIYRGEIIAILKLFLSKNNLDVAVDVCNDPTTYIKDMNPVKFPLVLISYSGSSNSMVKLFPGMCFFEMYFVNTKEGSDVLLDLMELVYGAFQQNVVNYPIGDDFVSGNKLNYQGQSFHAETNEYVIYLQKYSLLIP